jgi:hypothetical protein
LKNCLLALLACMIVYRLSYLPCSTLLPDKKRLE